MSTINIKSAKKQNTSTCELCLKENSFYLCIQCQQNCCEECQKIHLRSKATSNHTFETLLLSTSPSSTSSSSSTSASTSSSTSSSQNLRPETSTNSSSSSESIVTIKEKPHLQRKFKKVEKSSQPDQLAFKIVVVGEVKVGKTSVIQKYVTGIYASLYQTTLGVDYRTQILIDTISKTQISLQFWDVSGSERFGQQTTIYYRGALAAIVAFSCEGKGFERVASWKQDVNNNVGQIPCFLFVTQCDKEWNVSKEQINKCCKENGFLGWFETSAKKGTGVNEAFHHVAHHLIYLTENQEDDIVEPDPNPTIKLTNPVPTLSTFDKLRQKCLN